MEIACKLCGQVIGNVVEVEQVVTIGGAVPLDVGKLPVVPVVQEAAVDKELSNVGMLRFVGALRTRRTLGCLG